MFSSFFYGLSQDINEVLQKRPNILIEEIFDIPMVEDQFIYNEQLSIHLIKHPEQILRLINYALYPREIEQNLIKHTPKITKNKLYKYSYLSALFFETKPFLIVQFLLGKESPQINKIAGFDNIQNNNEAENETEKKKQTIREKFQLFIKLATEGGCEQDGECLNIYCKNNQNFQSYGSPEILGIKGLELVKNGTISQINKCEKFTKHSIGGVQGNWQCQVCKMGNPENQDICRRCDSPYGEINEHLQKEQKNLDSQKKELEKEFISSFYWHNNIKINQFDINDLINESKQNKNQQTQ
ncbi:hypothetical protein PPERSA_02145 [Pseudocohnilembus persalinus]|uniref:RanBP2-type domain-containing protein n=1 Tax=Pseudocohnilembus persalinus TaxID=266149 RepID=A0A0V0Q7Z4_PSEPJ|nr:hypothetical protein PPERSA_02145 [Pseudocohnilembus persalinus]|eukprot:KRW98167.1 hypothetical protein PPERSA_02145 [Pseudocohnilembus persalinus]